MAAIPTTRVSLMLRLRDSQDHAAWLEFVSLYEPATYRLMRRYGLQDADAQEIVQQLFMAVSRNIDRWDPSKERGSLRGWLRTTARNLVINWLKQRQRRALATGDSNLQALLDMLPAESDPETVEFDLEWRRAMFQRAAERVEAEVRPATWQAFWETAVVGTPAAQAAKKLQMAVGAVRVAKCRVLARLQTVIKELEANS